MASIAVATSLSSLSEQVSAVVNSGGGDIPPPVYSPDLDGGNAFTDTFFREVDGGNASTSSFVYDYNNGNAQLV